MRKKIEEPEEPRYIYPQRACEDCNDIVRDRRINYHKAHTPSTHWKSKCTACGLYKNPVTDKFELTSLQLISLLKSKSYREDK